MLSVNNFSYLVSAGCLILLIISFMILITYALNRNFRNFVRDFDYNIFSQSSFVITLISIIGALIYQEYYDTPVCPMCWQQRMIIYAILIVSLVGSLAKDKMNYIYTGALAIFGLYLASEHYYYHFIKYVLKDELSLPCDVTGVSCSESAIGVIFGFITIPFMSICVFVSVIIIAFLAYKNSK